MLACRVHIKISTGIAVLTASRNNEGNSRVLAAVAARTATWGESLWNDHQEDACGRTAGVLPRVIISQDSVRDLFIVGELQ